MLYSVAYVFELIAGTCINFEQFEVESIRTCVLYYDDSYVCGVLQHTIII